MDASREDFKSALNLVSRCLTKVEPIKVTQEQSDKLDALVCAYNLCNMADKEQLTPLENIWKEFVIVESNNGNK